MGNITDHNEALYAAALIDLENSQFNTKKLQKESEDLIFGLNLLVSSLDKTNILIEMILLIRKFIKCDDVFILVLDDSNELKTKASTSKLYYKISFKHQEFFNRILDGNESILLDYSSMPELESISNIFFEKNIKSEIFMPLIVEGRKAILILVDARENFFSHSDVDLIKRYSMLASQALYMVLNNEQSIKSNNQQKLQFSIAKELSSSLSLKDVSSVILYLLCNYLEWEIGMLWLVDEKDNKLKLYDTWSVDSALKDFIDVSHTFEFSPGIGLPGRIWVNKTVSSIINLSVDENFPRIVYARNINLHSAVGFPVILDDKVYAVIECFSRKTQHSDLNERSLFIAISNQLGDFIKRISVQNQIDALNKELIKTARIAGMAEVSTSVLHNVGNILNSVNTSSQLLFELISRHNLDKIKALAMLLRKNYVKLGSFFKTDPKGKYVLDYLEKITIKEEKLKQVMLNEVQTLDKNIENIKNKVLMQLSIAKPSTLIELTNIIDLIQSSVNIHKNWLNENSINIKINNTITMDLFIDKNKVEQILINLISNAIDALIASNNSDKNIIITAQIVNKNILMISVADNGIGIISENLSMVFNFGFTTKKEGHGFGLHNSALAVKEMGGSLQVTSAGKEQGTVFILNIPYMIK